MHSYSLFLLKAGFALLVLFGQQPSMAQGQMFKVDSTQVNPWTKNPFENNPQHFQFAIVTDRTGGHRVVFF